LTLGPAISGLGGDLNSLVLHQRPVVSPPFPPLPLRRGSRPSFFPPLQRPSNVGKWGPFSPPPFFPPLFSSLVKMARERPFFFLFFFSPHFSIWGWKEFLFFEGKEFFSWNDKNRTASPFLLLRFLLGGGLFFPLPLFLLALNWLSLFSCQAGLVFFFFFTRAEERFFRTTWGFARPP